MNDILDMIKKYRERKESMLRGCQEKLKDIKEQERVLCGEIGELEREIIEATEAECRLDR